MAAASQEKQLYVWSNGHVDQLCFITICFGGGGWAVYLLVSFSSPASWLSKFIPQALNSQFQVASKPLSKTVKKVSLLIVLHGNIWLLGCYRLFCSGQDKGACTSGCCMPQTYRGLRQLGVLGEKPKEVVTSVTSTTFHLLEASH